MLRELDLRDVGPAPEMGLDLAPRLNLLTGDNGLGKSFLLDIAWWALTRQWPAEVNPALTTGRMARPAESKPGAIEFMIQTGGAPGDVVVTDGSMEIRTSTFDRSQQTWIGSEEPLGHPVLVLYAQVDGSFAVWDPARNYRRPRGQVAAQEGPLAYVFTPREVWDGLQPDTEKPPLCNGLIRDWARWQESKGEAFRRLTAVLEALSPDPGEKLEPGELTRISLDDARDIPTLRMLYGQDVPVLHASAGMRRIMALAYLLVWSWEEHVRASKLRGQATAKQAVFLIDEIEAHLHPRWQRTIVRALLEVVQQLSKEMSVQLIAATHSPLVMASVEPWFEDGKDAWFDLDLVRTNGTSAVEVKRRSFVRRGDVSNWLTSEAFDLKSARSQEAERAIERARALLASRTAPAPDEVREVDEALRTVLSDIDPFWVRWRAFAERFPGVRQ